MTPLRELNAFLETRPGGLPVLLFDCPCGCGALRAMPYSETGNSTPTRIVWKRLSGTTPDDLTLAPSFRVIGECGLHGFVRSGQWVPC